MIYDMKIGGQNDQYLKLLRHYVPKLLGKVIIMPTASPNTHIQMHLDRFRASAEGADHPNVVAN